jgi:hypothetical protein
MQATLPGRFTGRHTWNGGADGGGDAAGATAFAAVHDPRFLMFTEKYDEKILLT